ncbi:MAG: ABC transporter permease [Solirubrobacteraceae bacterium]
MSGLRSALAEAVTSIARQPMRTLLCALGTVVAVGAFTTTNGLTESASSAVSASFNELRATTVEFQGPSTLSETDVARLARLHGVTRAGLVWDLDQQQPLPVAVGPSASGPSQTQLSVTAMSPSALAAIGAVLSSGRFYDTGADLHHQMVALLGSGAASQLGISSSLGNPAINVSGIVLTVVGIVSSSQQEAQALLGVIVPPYVAGVIAGDQDPRRVIARTSPGAAQLIGRQGPAELDPYQPGLVTAEVPPNPTTQRAQVQASLSTLLGVLSVAGLGIGFLTIAAVTIMSVAQRRSEIGLRRAVGYGRLEVARLIVLEASGVGLLGGILGASIGVLATSAIASGNHWTPVMNTTLVLAAPFLGVAVGALAGSYPAIRAARITPMAALRS